MSSSAEVLEQQRVLRHDLQDTVDLQTEPEAIPFALARVLRASDAEPSIKEAGLGLIASWIDYVNKYEVTSDPYAIRYHITQFAAQEFGEERTYQDLKEIDISDVAVDGRSYSDILSSHVSPDILTDTEIAIVGGAARLAVKMYAGVGIASELPISDIDAVITTDTADVAAKAASYGIDLSGTKIVDSDVRSALDKLVTNSDCTMNQVAIHGGNLLFSEKALKDIQEGNIRLIAKNDPLFGSEGVVLPDGNVYINRAGFYRGLSFLLRGKGDRLIVSHENIDQEKDNIGRYWQVMLFVKLATMQDEALRHNAIGQWHELAQRMGSTATGNALEFLDELMEAYPETKAASAQAYNPEAQARWVVKRLVSQAVQSLYGQEEFVPPATYTEANLSLADTFADYDYDAMMRKLTSLR